MSLGAFIRQHGKIANTVGTITQIIETGSSTWSQNALIKTDTKDYFIKVNLNGPDDFFSCEARGLIKLKNYGLPTPEIILSDKQFLLLENLRPSNPNQSEAGKHLAHLHNRKTNFCGLENDNYLASLKQYNTVRPAEDWYLFYARYRLKPLLNILEERKFIHSKEKELWQNFLANLEQKKFTGYCAPLHGDLWGGNLFHSTDGPVFIDPSFYYGDPAVDIAMTKLFGGFSSAFYNAYFAAREIPAYDEETIGLYQLYPLLAHACLFDSYSSGGYYSQAVSIAQKSQKNL